MLLADQPGKNTKALAVRRAGLVLAGACLSLVVSACTKPAKPADPGLAADRLGIGIHLGMAVDEAQDAAGSHDGLELLVMTREQLAGHSPYEEMPAEGDLVVALYNEYPLDGSQPVPGMLYGRVNEVRCFLGATAHSRVQLLGQPVAGLNPAGMEQVFGHADERVVSSDGATHLRYEFDLDSTGDKDMDGMAVRLVTSHNPDGNCFAMLVSLVPEL